MATTFSSNYQIKLIGDGLEAGTWGSSTNQNLQRLEEAIGGSYVSLDITSPGSASTYEGDAGANTLWWVTSNSAPAGHENASGRSKYIVLTGSVGADQTVKIYGDDTDINPERVFFVKNGITAPYDIILQCDDSSPGTYTLKNGAYAAIYTNSSASPKIGNVLSNMQVEGVVLAGATGEPAISVPTNLADALSIEDDASSPSTLLQLDTRDDVTANIDSIVRSPAESGPIGTATKTKPVVVTATNTFVENDVIRITGVAGMDEINRVFKVIASDGSTFSIKTLAGNDVDGTDFGAWTTSTGTAVGTTALVTTDVAHSFANNDRVKITGLVADKMTSVNNKTFTIDTATPGLGDDEFNLVGIDVSGDDDEVSGSGGVATQVLRAVDFKDVGNLDIDANVLDISTQSTVVTVADDTDSSLGVFQAGNSYIEIDTTDSSERVVIGRDSSDCDKLDIDTATVDLTSQATTLLLTEGSATSLDVWETAPTTGEGGVQLITVDTTTPKVTVPVELEAGGSLEVTGNLDVNSTSDFADTATFAKLAMDGSGGDIDLTAGAEDINISGGTSALNVQEVRTYIVPDPPVSGPMQGPFQNTETLVYDQVKVYFPDYDRFVGETLTISGQTTDENPYYTASQLNGEHTIIETQSTNWLTVQISGSSATSATTIGDVGIKLSFSPRDYLNFDTTNKLLEVGKTAFGTSEQETVVPTFPNALLTGTAGYLAFNALDLANLSSSYGIRNNSGTVQGRNSGTGEWAGLVTTTPNDGVTTGLTTPLDPDGTTNVVVVTDATSSGRATGDRVTISGQVNSERGLSPAQINGTYEITSTGADTYEITLPAIPDSTDVFGDSTLRFQYVSRATDQETKEVSGSFDIGPLRFIFNTVDAEGDGHSSGDITLGDTGKGTSVTMNSQLYLVLATQAEQNDVNNNVTATILVGTLKEGALKFNFGVPDGKRRCTYLAIGDSGN